MAVVSNPAHPDGHTCLAFSPDGAFIYTGGTDYLVRIWSIDNDGTNEPESATDAEHEISSLSISHDFWLSASDDLVRRYVKHDTQLHGFVTNTNGVRIRSVAIDPKGKNIAVASDELFIKLIDAEDTTDVQQLQGHTKGVRQVSWDPTSNFLTSCGSDGKILVWNTSAAETTLEATIEGVLPIITDQESNEFLLHDCSAVWHPSGKCFYVVSRSHEIVSVNKSTWTKDSTFIDKDITGAITALAISPNGLYLASACQSNVYIWSTDSQRVVTRHIARLGGTVVTALSWCPTKNHLAWTDGNGEFFQWQKPISDGQPDPVKVINSSTTAKPRADLDLFGEEPLDTGTSALALDQNIDAEVEAEDDYDNWIVDDLGGGMQDEPTAGPKASDGYVKEMVSITKAQPAFQPGSTPMVNKKCFMAYNLIGVIEATDQDTYQIINVEFFDHSTRKNFHFTDHFKHNLGYLGERGAVFACPPEGEHPAQVLFRPYGNMSTPRKEWTYQLKRKDSRILGVAAGGLSPSSSLRETTDSDLQGYGDVAVATSEGDLTFLTGTGRERRIMGLGGDFVSMVASSEWLFVVYRAGSTTIDGSQNLSYCIINFDDFSVRQRGILPLPKGHTLKWIGLTDQNAPVTYDTTGCIHVLTKFRIPHHASWARILDTNLLERKQGKDESYWPVGMSENTFHCLILKGRQEYPAFPKPLIQELPIILPFRRDEPKEEMIERQLLYVQTSLDLLDEELTTEDIVSRERNIDKELILLIQAACKSDDAPRVIELVKLLHLLPSFDAAIKIAGFYHLLGLQEKLEVLKSEREEAEDRLEVLREKRKRWLKTTKRNGGGRRYDPLGDTGPPPMIQRPGMSRVEKPIVERTRFSSIAPTTQTQTVRDDSSMTMTRSPSPSPWDNDTELGGGAVSLNGNDDYNTLGAGGEELGFGTMTGLGGTAQKRKRNDDMEDVGVSQVSDVSIMPPPPKQKTNPFARKNNTSESNTTRNPFSLRPKPSTILNGGGGITGRGSIQKSDSFFDKVEAAADNGKKSITKKSSSKSTTKDKSSASASGNNGPKQTTLFGMMPRAFQTSQAPKKPSEEISKKQGHIDDGEEMGEETQELLGSCPPDIADMGASESQMTLMDSRGLEETQLDETQVD
ncbi:hypothetical protein AGABI1DRAFT_126609 [Agaricus bisporus var. burnettii JB137-S8]|uniref:Uncharacterized protein n=1 Tax=Agaricus bisporus var. burnettii (strain JB137-S8 / ATCC MYA-4627 / FGSC 10392) TaxID=597362 RepID=K5W176_AGABU|nr:uncharacterized protein AGABI1DRAFT_126609 [Agaricus bisporus var. burnettii JB137-S8]EKM80549.1 hypothetical protein AGABI1DRAFT_126609 [Agaricus bisporus var. burnettii JB137-S8]